MAVTFCPPSIPLPQRDSPELLDTRVYSRTEVTRSLRDVARINSFLGATHPLYDSLWRLIESAYLKRATVLDIGCGNGDFVHRLIHQSHQRGIELRVIALDISALHLEIASEGMVPLSLIQADAFHLPLRDQSVDIVTSSLFLHHFRPEAIQQILAECTRVARLGWIMNDCARDTLALWSFRLLRPYLARSFITRFDGPTSIRRAYTPTEMRAMLAPQTGATVRDYFPFRLQVEWNRPS
ncbi:ubiquinone/menaquinone biosynthesis C-methyltransferase UbiE [Abditibacteriota bacterium]|nr:ubiquinone/menaquinone biosynthesis C-methyltransferase UbiE [Abditibacteriota bacterium]